MGMLCFNVCKRQNSKPTIQTAQLLPWPPEVFVPVMQEDGIFFSFSPLLPRHKQQMSRMQWAARSPAPRPGQNPDPPEKGRHMSPRAQKRHRPPALQALGSVASARLSPTRLPTVQTSCSRPGLRPRQGHFWAVLDPEGPSQTAFPKGR